jgi:hypothetical protein
MALTQDDFVSAVAKLNELTRQQVIKWRPYYPPIAPSTSMAIILLPGEKQFSYEATHEGRLLRITQHTAPDRLFIRSYTYRYVLDMRDLEGNVLFEFPNVAGISDLFRTIERQALDLEGFIRELVAR